MTTVRAIEQALYGWAPRELAESWDNVGLLVGDPDASVSRILVALDITPAVVAEAADTGCQLIVAHHPVMNCAWHQVQTLRTDDRQGRVLTELVRHNIAAICMHTNLDAAEDGVNDVLARTLGLDGLEMLTEEKIGRVGTLKCEIPLVEFLPFVIKSLGCHGLRYVSCGKNVHRVAVGGGACGCYIPHRGHQPHRRGPFPHRERHLRAAGRVPPKSVPRSHCFRFGLAQQRGHPILHKGEVNNVRTFQMAQYPKDQGCG